MRDASALLNLELLPWDVRGAMPEPETPIGADLAALFDRLAVLTRTADESVADLQALRRDDRLRVPAAFTTRSATARKSSDQLQPQVARPDVPESRKFDMMSAKLYSSSCQRFFTGSGS